MGDQLVEFLNLGHLFYEKFVLGFYELVEESCGVGLLKTLLEFSFVLHVGG